MFLHSDEGLTSIPFFFCYKSWLLLLTQSKQRKSQTKKSEIPKHTQNSPKQTTKHPTRQSLHHKVSHYLLELKELQMGFQ